MVWFNPFGLLFIVLIMIPNIIYAVNCKDKFDNQYNNKTLIVLEQIGRYGCFTTMIFNIPFTVFGFWSDEAFAIYLIVDTVLILIYCLIWIVCFRKNGIFKSLSLSILPSVIFLFSGIMTRSVLLTVAAVIFAPCHVLISYRNTLLKNK